MRYCDDIIYYIASMNGDILIFIASVEDNASVAAEAVAMRCRGGGKLDDSSGNKKNEHSIDLFENTKFILPGVAVAHFNEIVKPALDAGLASVSFSGTTMLSRAEGNCPGGLGPRANPPRAFATPDQLQEELEGRNRLFGMMVQYLPKGSPHKLHIFRYHAGDGYTTYQFIIRYGRRLRTEREKAALRSDWEYLSFENALSKSQQEDQSAQITWASIVMEKGIQLGQPIVAGPTSADFLFQKYITKNHVGYKDIYLSPLTNQTARPTLPSYPTAAAIAAGNAFPPFFMPNLNIAGSTFMFAGGIDIITLASNQTSTWIDYLMDHGVKADPFVQAVQLDGEDTPIGSAYILTSQLTDSHECNYCKKMGYDPRGHYVVNIDDNTKKKIYCTHYLIDNGFEKVSEIKDYAKPFKQMASSAKRISNTFRKGAKALLVAMSGNSTMTDEVRQVIDDLDDVSDDSDSSHASEADSFTDAMANKISDTYARGSTYKRANAQKHRSKSPGNHRKQPHSRH